MSDIMLCTPLWYKSSIAFTDIYVWKLTFLLSPFILHRRKVKIRSGILPCHSHIVLGSWKGIEMGKEENSPPVLTCSEKIKAHRYWWRNGAFQMIHDGFIYLATLMLLAAILVNLPVYLRGRAHRLFLNLHHRSFWSFRHDAFMHYESMGFAGYVSRLCSN